MTTCLRQRAYAVVACLTVVAALAACNTAAPAPSPPTSRAAGSAATPTAAGSTATSFPGLTAVTPAAIPTEPSGEPTREARSPDPAFDYGFVIDITPIGFHPSVLVSGCCAAVTWINLTNKTNRVLFTVELTESPPIPPGGSWTWIPPNGESVVYQSVPYPTMTGAIQVNQTSN